METSVVFVKAIMTYKELTREAAIGDEYCIYKNCKEEKSVLLVAQVTTLRSIHGCGKCGGWSPVHKVSFTLQEHVKTSKTDETRCVCQKLSAGKQKFVNVPIQSTKYKKDEMFSLYVDDKS